MIDSRAGRVLDEGNRSMLDDDEWEWVEEHACGGFDHLLIATSLPWLLSPAMHHLEAWNERVCGGAWGSVAARAGEKVRQGLDLEHWGAFNESFERLAEIQRSVGAGERGEPPASDRHALGRRAPRLPQPRGLPARRRACAARSTRRCARRCATRWTPGSASVINFMVTRPALALTRALSRAAGVPDPSVRWRMCDGGPWFDNQVGTLHVRGRELTVELEKTVADGGRRRAARDGAGAPGRLEQLRPLHRVRAEALAHVVDRRVEHLRVVAVQRQLELLAAVRGRRS